jgi:hypothetical protein
MIQPHRQEGDSQGYDSQAGGPEQEVPFPNLFMFFMDGIEV